MIPIIGNRGDWLQTISGTRFYPLDPKPEEIDIRDIAYGLSMKGRYNGHVKQFRHYSVAEHSILLANNILYFISMMKNESPYLHNEEKRQIRLWALLHDAAEAYIPDMPRPIKRHKSMKAFCQIEKRIMRAVAKRFDLYPLEEPEIVKRADTAILRDEKHQCMEVQIPWNKLDLEDIPLLGVKISFIPPNEIYDIFIDTYNRLSKDKEP